MKKVLLAALIILMTLCGCAPSSSRAGVPEPTENDIDLSVISDIMMENLGKWACAGQFETQYIYMENGLIYMESTETGSKKYVYKPINYTVEGTTYAISFDSADGFVLHVDIANIGTGRITAENRYQGDSIAEYARIVDMDESMKPKVYVLVDDSLNKEYLPTLTLYADNSFSFVENVYEGMATITGHWAEKEGYIVLYITDKHEMEGYAGYQQQEIGMKIVDGGLKMENDLCYSRNGDFFAESAQPVDIDESMKPKVYVLVDDSLNKEYLPTLTLYADNSFSFVENVYEGMATITGHWAEKEGYIVLYITDKHEMEGFAGYQQQEIGMKIVDGGLKMENDLCYSRNGDFFAESAQPVDIDESMKPKVYVLVDDSLNKEYLPTLTLYADNSFSFVENLYEGMATITGHWAEKEGYIVLYITDKHEMEGFAGYQQQEIGMKIVDGGLKMENDLCYSRNGDFFKQQ